MRFSSQLVVAISCDHILCVEVENNIMARHIYLILYANKMEWTLYTLACCAFIVPWNNLLTFACFSSASRHMTQSTP